MSTRINGMHDPRHAESKFGYAPVVDLSPGSLSEVATKKEAALHYAAAGWAVLPIYEIGDSGLCACGAEECKSPGKHPRTRHGLSDAITDRDSIEGYWRRWPLANIGIATGKISGMIALDIDPRHGGDDSLARLVKRHGALFLDTLTQTTGGGGRHLFFKHWSVTVKNRQSTAELGPGIDVRGDGGYVVAAPSNHISGSTYCWESLDSERLLDCPDWLRDALAAGPPDSNRRRTSFAGASTDKIGQGDRHRALVSLAGKLRSSGLDSDEIFDALVPYNGRRCDPPKNTPDLRRIARDIARRYSPDLGSSPTSVQPWGRPEPIDEQLPLVQPCDPIFLPESFRSAATDIADRMQVPLDFVAAALVVTLAGSVNRRVQIQPKAQDDQWLVVPNLWGGIIGTPGVMKTPVITATTRPLIDCQSKHSRSYASRSDEDKRERERYGLERDAWSQLYKKWVRSGRKGEEPKEPERPAKLEPAPRFVLTDATFEALHRVMSENAAGVFVLRDELSGWLAMLDRAGREGERAFCLEAWSGTTSYTIDRIDRGTVHVPHCCMSLFGSIQPARFRSYLRDAVQDGPANDGLVQRLQVIVWPDVDKKWVLVDRPCDQQALDRVAEVLGKLIELPVPSGAPWRFAQDAQPQFNEWLRVLHERLRVDELHPALASHLSKYKSLVPSLALLFELADRVADDRLHGDCTVSTAHLEQAINYASYLENHAERIYSCLISPEMSAAQELAAKIKAGKLGEIFNLRSVYRPRWSGLTSTKIAKQAVEVLIDHGWVRRNSSASTPGRPADQFEVNPEIWAKKTSGARPTN